MQTVIAFEFASVSQDFWINISAGFTQTLLILIISFLWRFLSDHLKGRGPSKFLLNRRNFIVTSVFSIILPILIAVALFPAFRVPQILAGLTICTLLIVLVLISVELNSFWKAGFTHVQSKIPKDTYRTALRKTTSEFLIIGTNAYNFASLPEFAEMVRRVRECSGKIQIVMAHPDSIALREAARLRSCREDLYRDQARFSLGVLLNLREQLSTQIEIRLYESQSVGELPIFRSMFVDNKECITSIAVYGRIDHGRSLPQIIAGGRDGTRRPMYNALHRYYVDFYNKSSAPSLSFENQCKLMRMTMVSSGTVHQLEA
ncbi:hypothetical protein [Rhodococcus sp. NPDC060176]|uniref:hypothetical protein n=1 Tax=unclassified Rhodococcus (in: high G+C Gram-positive bacteria) TaxID=192944 RepID=UPI0036536431